MRLFINIDNDVVHITGDMKAPELNIVGQMYRGLRQGEEFEGITYDQFISHGSGVMEIEVDGII